MNEIGIIIPTYNRQKELVKTLNVILRGSELPIFVCLNKDPQNTASILDKLKTKYPRRLIYIINKTNIGMTANFYKVATKNPFNLSIFYCDDDIPNILYLKEISDSFKKEEKCIFLPSRNIPEKFKDNIMISSWFASQALPGLAANTSLFKKYFPKDYSEGLYPQIEFSLEALKDGIKVNFLKEDPCKGYAEISAQERLTEQSRDLSYNFSERLINLSKYVSKKDFSKVLLDQYYKEIAWTYAHLPFTNEIKAFKKLIKGTSKIVPWYLLILIFLYTIYYRIKIGFGKN